MRTPRTKKRTPRSRSRRSRRLPRRARSLRPKLRGGTILDVVAPLLRPTLPYYSEQTDDRYEDELYRLDAIDPRIRKLKDAMTYFFLTQWQGLDQAVLYSLYLHNYGRLGDANDFVEGRVTPQQFFDLVSNTITNELTTPLLSPLSLSTRSAQNDPNIQARIDTRAALLGMLPKIFRIQGLLLYAPFTAEARGLDPDNQFRPRAISYSSNPELLRYTERMPRSRTARVIGEYKRARLQDYDELLCAPDLDPQHDARRAAFRAFIDRQSPRAQTGVVVSFVHGQIVHVDRKGFRAWTIPPGRSLIMVTVATPACVNITHAIGSHSYKSFPVIQDTKAIIQSMLKTYHQQGTTYDPIDFAENAHILNEMNNEKRKQYDRLRTSAHDAHGMTFAAQCQPVRITYFQAGDACIDKFFELQKTDTDVSSDWGTRLLLPGGSIRVNPPILNGHGTVHFCLSETINNIWRRGYTNVVLYDFSCSIVNNYTTGAFLSESGGGNAVSVALQRSGLAGGAQ